MSQASGINTQTSDKLVVLQAGESIGSNNGVRTVELGIASGLANEGITTRFLGPKCTSTEELVGRGVFLPAKLRGWKQRGYYGTPIIMPELNAIVDKELEEVGLLVVQSISVLSARTMFAKRRMTTPLGAIFHGHTMDDRYIRKWFPIVGPVASSVVSWAMKHYILNHVDEIIVPSDLLARMYMRRFKLKRKPTVWAAPVVIPRDLPEETELAFDDRFTLIYVGRIGKEKNIETLLTLFSRLYYIMPRARLVLIGGGEVARHQAIARKLPFRAGEGVEFLGNQSFDRIQAINRKAALSGNAIGISCSRTETQGVALLEQLAAGLPVTVYDGTVWTEDLEKSRTGLLLSGRSIEEDACSLKELARDTNQRLRMAEFGPALIQQNHNPITQYKKLAKIYRRVAES